jgi:hypothetical protein
MSEEALKSLKCPECGKPASEHMRAMRDASKHLSIQSQQSILLHHLNAAPEAPDA